MPVGTDTPDEFSVFVFDLQIPLIGVLEATNTHAGLTRRQPDLYGTVLVYAVLLELPDKLQTVSFVRKVTDVLRPTKPILSVKCVALVVIRHVPNGSVIHQCQPVTYDHVFALECFTRGIAIRVHFE